MSRLASIFSTVIHFSLVSSVYLFPLSFLLSFFSPSLGDNTQCPIMGRVVILLYETHYDGRPVHNNEVPIPDYLAAGGGRGWGGGW